MAYKKQILLGKISKVHGHDGAVNVRLEQGFSENIQDLESVFIETDGRPVPFFIASAEQPDNLVLRLWFEGYESADDVKEFVGCRLFLTEPSKDSAPVSDPIDLINYKLFSQDNTTTGVITGIIENPGQILLNILTPSGSEFLIPLHEDLVKEIDTENRIIYMFIPEGIADIN
jgi:16S rRNA processing protein RimM